MIELDVARPAELDRAAIIIGDAGAFEAAGHVERLREARHRRQEFLAIAGHVRLEHRRKIIDDDRREAGLEMVHARDAGAHPADAEIAAGLEHRGIDLGRLPLRPLQLETDLARHALPQRAQPAAGNLDHLRMHELDVAHVASGRLLDRAESGRAGDLEHEPVVRLGHGIVAAVAQIIVRPEAAAAEEHIFVVREAAQDAFMDDLAILVGVDEVLGLADREVREAVDRNVGQQSRGIGPVETPLRQERPIADIACLLPGHAFVHPVRIFRLAEADIEISFGRTAQFIHVG